MGPKINLVHSGPQCVCGAAEGKPCIVNA